MDLNGLFDTDKNVGLVQELLALGFNPNTPYLTACSNGRVSTTALFGAIDSIHETFKMVKTLLDAEYNMDEGINAGLRLTLIQRAALRRKTEVVQLLLDKGFDPNAVPPKDQRPSIFHGTDGAAIQSATENGDITMVRQLLQHGANVDITTREKPSTSLQLACDAGEIEIVRLLLEYGANVNAPPAEDRGATALQFAAMRGFFGIAYLLVTKGANVNACAASIDGRTALEGAAEHGRIDMVQFLRNAGADISESGGGQYERALERAYQNGHFALRKLLISYLD